MKIYNFTKEDSIDINLYFLVDINYNLTKMRIKYSNIVNVERDSFSCNYLLSIFDSIFNNNYDLRIDYNDFYKLEYSNFEEYLYKKELLNFDQIQKININENNTILKLNPDLNDYNIRTIIENDDFLKEINYLLEEVINYEDKK